MKIRRLEGTDADRLEWMRMRCALWPHCPPERHALEIRMAEEAGDYYAVFVVERDDGVAGLGGFAEVSVRHGIDGAADEDVGYVEGWYVEAALRGRGVGRALLAAAEEWTRARGLHQLGSDAEWWNDGSIAAHKALGFRETDRIVQFLKDLGPR
jgi:aminoglycoside 6'-N-acetyltransferase I